MSRLFAATLASAALVTALSCGSAAAVDAVAGTQLVMHVGPGAEHRGLATIPAEMRVTVHGCSEAEGWCLVRFAGRLGWVEGESLDVVGFSRRAKPAIAAPVKQVIIVPEPALPHLPHPGFVTADDVIVAMGEHFGLAVLGHRTRLDLSKRHRGGLAFKRHGFDHKAKFRQHGHFKPRHDGRDFHFGKPLVFDGARFGKPGARSTKDIHVQRARFGKHGRFAGHGKGFHIQRAHFGKRGRFAGHGDWHFGKGHAKWHIAKHGKGFGRSGKARIVGFRLKGGWRP